MSGCRSRSRRHVKVVMAEEKTMKTRQKGFMLIEIIAVLVMMSILSIAFTGIYLNSDAELVAGIDTLKSHLRYAQSRAMSTDTQWYVAFDTASPPGSYTLYQRDAGGTVSTKTFPAETDTAVPLTTGITIADGTVRLFNALGQPFTDAAGTTALTTATKTLLSTSVGDVVIQPETGFIE